MGGYQFVPRRSRSVLVEAALSISANPELQVIRRGRWSRRLVPGPRVRIVVAWIDIDNAGVLCGREVARYGQGFKDKAVARLLPPESAVLEAVTQELGVSAATLVSTGTQFSSGIGTEISPPLG
jgi:hypothetical protein